MWKERIRENIQWTYGMNILDKSLYMSVRSGITCYVTQLVTKFMKIGGKT